ncbi:MAG: TIM barrel protein [Planctomycetota bacterium]|nr:sugar phosphate isomerase/epimerase [Planctomycetota bacterium]MDW8373432.1 TIM barrel protein [Planctomycetota bacterium]
MRAQLALSACAAPWLPIDELAPLAVAAGFHALDLTCAPVRFDPARAPGFWDNNAAVIDLTRLDVLIPHLARTLREWNLACSAIALPAGSERALPPGALPLARALRCFLIRIPAPRPEPPHLGEQWRALRAAWRELAAFGAGEGLRFLIETRDGTLVAAPSAALRLLEDLDPRAVGIAYDIASTAREGHEAPAVAVPLMGGYLAHVIVRDVWLRSGGAGWTGLASGYAPLGQGALRWPMLLTVLANAPYTGWLALENCTGLDLGPARIARDAAWIQGVLAELRTASAERPLSDPSPARRLPGA